uniref:Uncharacterized protein n=1 Tax=Salmonella dublin TaxID=98360 RepID=Q4L1V1_SALDU|nr:hypothetical protein [Salmonella enterica subsp. enterica serovar Dublin]
MQKNVTPGRRKGCPNYSPEFKQQLVRPPANPAYPSQNWRLKTALTPICCLNGAREKLLLPFSYSPVTLNATSVQPELTAEGPEVLSISCEATFWHGTLRLNGTVSEKLLTLLIQELKR